MELIPLYIAFILFFLDVPVAFSMLAAALVYFGFLNHTMPADLMLQQFVSGVQSFPLLAIPFFTMAGVVMNYSGITERLMTFAELMVGHMKGGYAQANVVMSVLMGGICGSSNADAAMETKIFVPEMVKRGYSAEYSAVITATSSCITAVIPPGIMMILYCIVARVSIGKMFLAGYIPGLIVMTALMITVNITSRKKGYGQFREKKATSSEIAIGAKAAVLALIMPFGIIAALRFGVFTATEAGAMAVMYCFIIGLFVYKALHISDFPAILLETLHSTGSIMFIIVGANLFGVYLTYERIPHYMSEYLANVTSSPIIFLLLVNIFLLIVGMFLDGSPAILILGPLLAPVAVSMGIDPVHFGIICLVNLVIGGITPPFASMMFIVCAMLQLPVEKFIREIWPFLIALFISLGIITLIPQAALFLPNLIIG